MFPWQLLITGAVGVGGTALGAWLNGRSQTKSLRLSLDADNERARLAEKRRAYANCLAAFAGTMNSIAKSHAFDNYEGGDTLAESLAIEYSATLATQQTAVAELLLIAPEHIRRLAVKASTKLGHYDGSEAAGAEFRAVRDRLIEAMRADLGETEESA